MNKKDYRQGQKVVMTIEIEDKGQDFIELDLLANGVLLGDSVMFKDGRVSLLGIGNESGTKYHYATEVIQTRLGILKLKGLAIYIKETRSKDPLPWNAQVLKYKVTKIKKAKNINRFLTK